MVCGRACDSWREHRDRERVTETQRQSAGKDLKNLRFQDGNES